MNIDSSLVKSAKALRQWFEDSTKILIVERQHCDKLTDD